MSRLFAALLAVCGIAGLGSDVRAAAGETAVIRAVKTGNRTAVRDLIRQHADVNAPEADGTTALHWAVRGDDLETVNALLRGGANAKAANRYGLTPLSLAATNGNAAIIETLLKAGADANTAASEGETVLMTAARTGRIDAVKALLAHGANPNVQERFLGETALMWAAAEGHAEATRALLEVGAEVDTMSTVLDTPKLSFPRSGGPNTPFPRGGWTAAMYAARQGSVETVQLLADKGANLNVQDPDGTTALMFAIINAHYDSAAVLINKGADLNVGDSSGMTALYAAVDMHTLRWNFGRPAPLLTDKLTAVDVIRMMLDHGANPNAPLRRSMLARHHQSGDGQLGNGTTPLMRAAKTADAEVVKLLLDRGADGTTIMPNGTTVMMIASGIGTAAADTTIEVEAPRVAKVTDDSVMKVLEMCLDRCGDINAFNLDGDSAVFGAVNRGPRALKFVLDHGARADVKNKRGLTPIDVALGRGGRGRVMSARPDMDVKGREAMAAMIRQYLPPGFEQQQQQQAAKPATQE